MTNLRSVPSAEEAEQFSGKILDAAISSIAKLTNETVALKLGWTADCESKVREMRHGTKPFTLRMWCVLSVTLPKLARAISAEMMARVEPDRDAVPVVHAVQCAALAGAEMARVGIAATMDGQLTQPERASLRVQLRRNRDALDVLDSALSVGVATKCGVA